MRLFSGPTVRTANVLSRALWVARDPIKEELFDSHPCRGDPMLSSLAQNWWMFLVRGILAIAFGVIAFAWPGLTVLTLVLLYAAHAILDGATALGLALSGHVPGRSWWAMVLVGIIGILAGISAFVWPGITAAVLLTVVAIWAILRGVFEIAAAIHLRKEIEGELLLGIAGAASIAFGVMLLAWPAAGLVTIAWIIGANAMVFGAMSIGLALRLRKISLRHPSEPAVKAAV
jgi:uncharacterized membrane protein HdeD (DUF308 family)